MTNQDTPSPLSRAPLDILQNLGSIVESLQPELLQSLGSVAARGANAETQEWVGDLSDATYRLQMALHTIFEAIQQTPTFDTDVLEADTDTSEETVATDADITVVTPEVDEMQIPEADEVVVDEVHQDFVAPEAVIDDASHIQIALDFVRGTTKKVHVAKILEHVFGTRYISKDEFDSFAAQLNRGIDAGLIDRRGAYYRAVPEVIDVMVEEPVVDNVVEDAVVEDKSEPEISAVEDDLLTITEFGLSPNELAITRATLSYLGELEDRQSLRSITMAVFGTARLPKTEERRLQQILDRCVDAGMLRSYGKTYGFKTLSERQATDAPHIDVLSGDDLDDTERALIDFMKSNAQNGEINIGEIVRRMNGLSRTQVVERGAYLQYVDKLNNLADRGYIIHAQNSPWYGFEQTVEVKAETAAAKPKNQYFPSIQTPVKDAVATPTEAEGTVPVGMDVQPAQEAIDFAHLDLTDREVEMANAILRSVKAGEWFSRGDIDPSGIKFGDEQGSRSAFSHLANKLLAAGILIDNGKARGGRKLQINPDKLTPVAAPAQKVRVPLPRIHTPKPVKPRPEAPKFFEKQVEVPQGPLPEPTPKIKVPELSERERAHLLRNITVFVGKPDQPRKMKKGEVDQFVADLMGVKVPVARILVNQFIDGGNLHISRAKGSPFVVPTPPENGRTSSGEKKLGVQSQEAERIQLLKDEYGPEVLLYLNGLGNKSRSEFKTAIAAATELNGKVNVDDINPICRLLEAEGLVESVDPKGRGTGRTRKGVTWRLTGRGRGAANRLEMEGKLTAAQKKTLGNTRS